MVIEDMIAGVQTPPKQLDWIREMCRYPIQRTIKRFVILVFMEKLEEFYIPTITFFLYY